MNEALVQTFVDSYHDESIQSTRLQALAVVASSTQDLSNHLDVAGFVQRDDSALGFGLLCRLASSLISGLGTLVVERNVYASAALLRQLIEIEYLLFLGFKEPDRLGAWFRSSQEVIRREFSPQKMRNESDGLFRDEEYWLHCDFGGHPNPRAKTLFRSIGGINSLCFLVPDSVQHVRRLWNSVRLIAPQIYPSGEAIEDILKTGNEAITTWENTEHPQILAFDGIAA